MRYLVQERVFPPAEASWKRSAISLEREFEIRSGDAVLAKISRSLFQLQDRYAVDVSAGQDDALMLAVAISVDRIEADQKAEREAAQRQYPPSSRSPGR